MKSGGSEFSSPTSDGQVSIGQAGFSAIRCPCCAATPVAASVPDSREGDLWCAACGWLLLREIVSNGSSAADWPVECPAHGPLRSVAGSLTESG
jgi:hypothetical protein